MNRDSCFKTKETTRLRKNTKCVENSSFEKMTTIPINFIELNYFEDVINEFNLIDLEIR